MFLALALASIAHADATFADASVSAESPSDGTCTISLELTSDDHLYVFDESHVKIESREVKRTGPGKLISDHHLDNL